MGSTSSVTEDQTSVEDQGMSKCQSSWATRSSKTMTPIALWRSWWPEFVFSIGGLLTFMIIIVVLYLHDQERQPSMPLGITLNSILALLSTISKASFMISIAEVTSQWKWNLYDTAEGHSFYDFTLVDLASRGFWGSLLLLWRFKWRHPVSLAAVLSIISVMTSPLTQQAIDYPTRPLGVHGDASVGATRHWTPLSLTDDRMPLGAALMEALYAPFSTPPKPIGATCPTANCTFEPYESIAMCVKVADVTDQLEVTKVKPDGKDDDRGMHVEAAHSFDENGDLMPMYYTTLANNLTFDSNYFAALRVQPGGISLAFAKDEVYASSLLDLYITYTRSDNPQFHANGTLAELEYGAFEILLHLCVNEYETVVGEGKAHTTVRSTRSSPLNDGRNETAMMIPKVYCPPVPWDGTVALICQTTDEGEGSMLLAGVSDDRHENGLRFEIPLMEEIAYGIIQGSHSVYGRLRTADGEPASAYQQAWAQWLGDALWGVGRNVTDPEEQLQRLRSYYGGVATTISNVIRTTNLSDVVHGTAWETEVYVDIRWGWLSFLAAELVLATVFIAFTTFMTHRAAIPVLKSSALATFLASDVEVQKLLGSIENLESAEEKAKKARVKFDHRNLVLMSEVSDADSVTVCSPWVTGAHAKDNAEEII